MKTDEFDYDLPSTLIAQRPLPHRDSSRLMVVKRFGTTASHHVFSDLDTLLGPGDTLVVNDSRVMPARLFGVRSHTQAKVELLLLRPGDDDTWDVLAKPGRRVQPGDVLYFGPQLSAAVVAVTEDGGRRVRFQSRGTLQDALAELGETPLPPYIHEALADSERYQTVYSRAWGSAAAPTAGLHFTDDLLQRLRAKGVEIIPLTLHVGVGTFRPVSVETISDHKMHAEYYHLPAASAARLAAAKGSGRRIIAVGTTVVRTLETAALNGSWQEASGWTDIFIYPGYTFRAVDGLITNFHLPKSSLLMLVSAFAGIETIRSSYQTAVREQYRFFSFGDAMLLI